MRDGLAAFQRLVIVLLLALIAAILDDISDRGHTTEIVLNCNPECEFDQDVETTP